MARENKLIAPRLPRGFEDRAAPDIAAVEAMIAKIKAVYERYGFDPIETPMFEYTETLGKFLPDTDRPNAGVFSLQDDDEQWMSLRYDLTAPLARYFAENFERLPKPFRSYRQGWVFRNEKPGPGRFRQFMQFDADTVGAGGPEADAEMCMMMADCMDALGLAGKYIVRINHRGLLESLILQTASNEQDMPVDVLPVMRSLDKFDRLGWEGVKALLTKGRFDESGARIEGNGLTEQSAGVLINLLQVASELDRQVGTGFAPSDKDVEVSGFFEGLRQSFEAKIVSEREGSENSELEPIRLMQLALLKKAEDAFADVRRILELVRTGEKTAERIRFDPTCVRGLEYYTGPVFEIELTFPVTNERGETVVFGSVGGGGRYDGLVSRFRKEPVPATGFSIGVSRLATALKLTGALDAVEPIGPVVVLVLDKDQTPRYQAIVSRLRNAGIRAEMYLGTTKNFGKQVAYADKRNSPAVIIEGTQEREQGIVQIKDLIAGKEAASAIKDNAEWKAERPGQFECKDAELVERVSALPAVRAWLDRTRR